MDTKQVASEVRKQLKEQLPGWKFSVSIERYSGGSSITLALMSGPAPVMLDGDGYAQLNHYTLLRGEWKPYNNGANMTLSGWNVMKKAADILI